jgi:hypothetical protein
LSNVRNVRLGRVGAFLLLTFALSWGYYLIIALSVGHRAVLKTGSIWAAAFLHGVVNAVYGFTVDYVVRPDDSVLSFGLGVYGLACLAIVVLWMLRDPVWSVDRGDVDRSGAGGGSPHGEEDPRDDVDLPV